jgi:ribosomal protein L14E/L6E/L27E
MTNILSMTDSSLTTTMVNVMREEEPLDDNTRLHYHRRMIEATERKRLAEEEMEAIKRVIIEDDEKRARKVHCHYSLTPLFLPDPNSDHYNWESLNELLVEPEDGTSRPRRKIVYSLVQAGTIVKLTTGKDAGLSGNVVSRWNKKKPRVAKHTMWNVQPFATNKIVRRMQKTLKLTDTSSGF